MYNLDIAAQLHYTCCKSIYKLLHVYNMLCKFLKFIFIFIKLYMCITLRGAANTCIYSCWATTRIAWCMYNKRNNRFRMSQILMRSTTTNVLDTRWHACVRRESQLFLHVSCTTAFGRSSAQYVTRISCVHDVRATRVRAVYAHV